MRYLIGFAEIPWMPVFISTSRKPAQLTRRVARTLSNLLGAGYENRGKRSGEEVAQRAAALGFDRVCFLYERKGNPSYAQFFDLKTGWLTWEIEILGIREFERTRRLPKEIVVHVQDTPASRMAALLELERSEVEGLAKTQAVSVALNKERIAFSFDGQPVLELKVRVRPSPGQPLGA